MWDVPGLLMAIGGLGLLAIGLKKKDKVEAGLGCCFIGSAAAGYLARSNGTFAFVQLLFAIAMAVLVVMKFRSLRKRDKRSGLRKPD